MNALATKRLATAVRRLSVLHYSATSLADGNIRIEPVFSDALPGVLDRMEHARRVADVLNAVVREAKKKRRRARR